jgi:hypothetical protein
MCCGSTGAVRAGKEWPLLLPSTPKTATTHWPAELLSFAKDNWKKGRRMEALLKVKNIFVLKPAAAS